MNHTIASNAAPFRHTDLVQVFGESACAGIPKAVQTRGVSTDTRTLEAGNLFVALRGERFDGHTLAQEALEKGAIAVLVESRERAGVEATVPIITAPNTLHALGRLAHFHRRRFTIPVLAVAGSAGKTTTKEMTARLLSEHFAVLKTEGNFNNQVGVPLTLLRLTEQHTAAVIEIGTNEPGEIAILSDMVAPTHGIITNIGKEHLEKLIDENGVEQEETALLRYLTENGGTAFININDARLRKYQRSGWMSYGLAEDGLTPDIRATFTLKPSTHAVLSITNNRTSERCEAHLQSVGVTGARNGLAAAAVGFGLRLTAEQIQRGLEGFRPATSEAGYGRMVAEEITLSSDRKVTLLNDCYNANPTSMYAALETLAATGTPRRIALLGDMRELGAVSQSEHDALLAALYSASWLNLAILTGGEMEAAYKRFTQKHGTTTSLVYCSTNAECALALTNILQTGDVLLAKASRGVRLEEALELLVNTNVHDV
jgi:UDP-N-acetylmuramoyl-tripeptide--D-alanyl-D-alanine ligase